MSTQKVKGFFERPEGNTGLIFIGAGILGLLIFGNYLAPFFISALQNTLHAMVLGGVVLGVISLAMNNKFRLLCWNLFKSAMRFITGWFVTIDPIGILKNYIESMEDRIRGIEKNIGKLTGQKRHLFETIESLKETIEKSMRMAQAAKNAGNKEQQMLATRKAGRAEESIKKLQKIHDKMEFLYNILDKMKKNVNFLLEDTRDEVKTKEIEYKSIKAAHKAMSSAEALINGDSQKELFEQSMEYLAEDIGTKLGEMDRFMDLSEEFMDGVDLQNGVWDQKGMEMLENWEKGSDILSYSSGGLKETSAAATETAKAAPAAPAKSSQMSSFFN